MATSNLSLWTATQTKVDIRRNFKIGQDEKGNKSIKFIKYYRVYTSGYVDKNKYKVFVNDFVKRDLSRGLVVRKNNDFHIRWGRIRFEKLKYSTGFEVYGNKYYKF